MHLLFLKSEPGEALGPPRDRKARAWRINHQWTQTMTPQLLEKGRTAKSPSCSPSGPGGRRSTARRLQLLVHPDDDDRPSRGQAERQQRRLHRRRPVTGARRAAPLTAAGSTSPSQPFFHQGLLYLATGLNQGLQVNYSGVGSGNGISDFQAGSVDFAASDVPMSSSDPGFKMPANRPARWSRSRTSLGGRHPLLQPAEGVSEAWIRLDAPTIAGIFDGSIKTWNASQITALNPGVTLPSHAIVPEVRADSSGTTYIFTDYLTTAAPSVWTLGKNKTITWPSSAVQTPKNSGVASSIKSTPYSIGYVELAYALQNNFTFAAVKNAAAAYVVPSQTSVAADADQKLNVTSTDFSIVNLPGAGSYPISGYSWAILLQKQKSATTGTQVVKVLDWTTHTGGGQDQASGLGYVMLPPGLQNSNRVTLADGDGPERADTAVEVILGSATHLTARG